MVTIECPQCHHKNPDDAEFCEQCGAELPVAVGSVAATNSANAGSSFIGNGSQPQATADDMVCPNCKAPYVQGDVFCFNCGQDLRNLPGNQAAASNPAQAAISAPAQNQAALPANNNVPANSSANNQPAGNDVSIDDWDKAFSNPGSSSSSANPASAGNSVTPAPVSTNGAAPQAASAFGATANGNAFSAPVASVNNPVQTTATAPQQLMLDVNGPYGNQKVEYTGRELLLGRTDVKTRIFPDVNLDDSAASRRHLSVWFEPGDAGFFVQDLESANGTNLNGQDIEPGVPVKLNNGDILKVGTRYNIQVHIS